MSITTLKTNLHDRVMTVELARPEVRNAFNDKLIDDLAKTFADISDDQRVRVVIFRAQGSTFCAGGDLKWMQASAKLTGKANLAETRKLTQMFRIINSCGKPVIGLVHGAAIGGGVGLVSVCDYVICSRETIFSLSEVRLGLIPACIGPFVFSKIGETYARAYFMSSERFSAQRAYEIGLVHELVNTPTDIEAACTRISTNLLQSGPNAVAAAKKLIGKLKVLDFEKSYEFVSKTLADLRVTPEAQEGFKAFFEKRKPKWQ